MEEPIREIEDGKVWYYESPGENVDEDIPSTKYEGAVEVHPNWVVLCDGVDTLLPRERIEQVFAE